MAKQNAAQNGPKAPPVVDPLAQMGIAEDPIERAEEPKPKKAAKAPAPESLDELDDLDVVPAVKGETIAAFDARLQAATIKGVDMIEVEPRLIQYIMRSRTMPEGNYITYRGIKLVAEGKTDEVLAAEARTTNDVLFPRGYGNNNLPADVK